jgi:hypothetical protein
VLIPKMGGEFALPPSALLRAGRKGEAHLGKLHALKAGLDAGIGGGEGSRGGFIFGCQYGDSIDSARIKDRAGEETDAALKESLEVLRVSVHDGALGGGDVFSEAEPGRDEADQPVFHW